MKKWREPEAVSVPEDLRTAVGGNQLTATALFRRGITTPEAALNFLDPNRQPPCLPSELPGISVGAERVEQAIQRGEKICVWGDFDVDGQTSTTILVETLGMLGGNVCYHIPNRQEDSHGVHLHRLGPLIDAGVSLVVTCDTGITAHESVDYAKNRGVDFVITDHHELPDQLPMAHAVANPRLLPEHHPLADLPGAGAAYMLASELFIRSGRAQEINRFLDLVALGIVADLAALRGETRKLVQLGLKALRCTDRLGLLALMEYAGVYPGQVTEEHIGYMIGPRLNALGRLDDAQASVEFLTTQNNETAHLIASNLESLNARRKLLTTQVYEGALAMIEREPALLDFPALVLAHPGWPGGVIGIVASHLVERFARPVVLLTCPDGKIARGSARSIDGVDITAAIASQAHLLEGYGGHPMAGGLSLQSGRIDEFRRGLGREVGTKMADITQPGLLEIDAVQPLPELNLELVQDLERLSPFGHGNPALILSAPGITLLEKRPVGKNGEHLQLIVSDDSGCTRRLIWWQGAEETNQPLLAVMDEKFDLAYKARSSNYRGQADVSIEFIDARPCPGTTIQTRKKTYQVIDLRNETLPMAALQKLAAQESVQVWAEAEAVKRLGDAGIPSQDRYHLSLAQTLIVWTTPPGPRELSEAINLTRPGSVIVFSIHPTTTLVEGFITRLAGVIKYAINRQGGHVSLQALAAATAQKEEVVRKGLTWLEARGFLRVLEHENDNYWLAEGSGKVGISAGTWKQELEDILEEVNAYRDYFRRQKLS